MHGIEKNLNQAIKSSNWKERLIKTSRRFLNTGQIFIETLGEFRLVLKEKFSFF